jgi:hypothetical protein
MMAVSASGCLAQSPRRTAGPRTPICCSVTRRRSPCLSIRRRVADKVTTSLSSSAGCSIRVRCGPFARQSSCPSTALRDLSTSPNLRILVAGGDGTVNWVLNSMRKLPFATVPPIAVCPLGTGNDLAQSLGWTGVADRTGNLEDDLSAMLGEIVDAEVIDMDRWLVKVTDGAALPDGSTELFMTNYFSLGVDSQVALKFHELRQAHPELFISQSTNRAHYALLGFTTMFDGIECVGKRARALLRRRRVDAARHDRRRHRAQHPVVRRRRQSVGRR